MGDVLKGTIAVSLPSLLDVSIDPAWFGLLAVLGHCYSIYIRFQGGKAVATSVGVLMILDPSLFGGMIAVFVITLLCFKMVSLSSILAAIYASVHAVFFSETTVIYLVLKPYYFLMLNCLIVKSLKFRFLDFLHCYLRL